MFDIIVVKIDSNSSSIYFDKYNELSYAKRKKQISDMILISYFLKHIYDDWFETEDSTDKEESVDLCDICLRL